MINDMTNLEIFKHILHNEGATGKTRERYISYWINGKVVAYIHHSNKKLKLKKTSTKLVKIATAMFGKPNLFINSAEKADLTGWRVA